MYESNSSPSANSPGTSISNNMKIRAYDHTKRAKVNTIRSIGACLRCKLRREEVKG
jgi:hypothetical protein